MEIELHEAIISDGIITASYTITDNETTSDVPKHQIGKKELIEFIIEKELSVYCSDIALGEYNEIAADNYLVENLNEVVSEYLKENLA